MNPSCEVAHAGKRIRAERLLLPYFAVVLLLANGCRVGDDHAVPNAKSRAEAEARPANSAADAPIFFEDFTQQSGVRFSFSSGHDAGHHTLLEWVGGGVAILDYDADGRSDLFFPGGGFFEGRQIRGKPPSLWRGFGDATFENATTDALLPPSPWYTHGCSVGDFDNDGFPDVLVTGYGGLQLFRNQGDGTFVEVAEAAGLDDNLWSTSAAWADFDGDGYLDLYVAHYLDWSFDNHPKCYGKGGNPDACPPKQFTALPDVAYRNHADGTFGEATVEFGFRGQGKGLGVVAADLDLDGDTDVYVGNDTTNNFLYLNAGAGEFHETGVLSGVSGDDLGQANGSMGVDVGDFNLDGLPDLWAANYVQESFALYKNIGQANFQHVSRRTGIAALGGLFVGFGTAFADFDRDGDEDIIVANGHVLAHPFSAPVQQLPILLANSGGRSFHRLQFSPANYFSQPHLGRGLAVGDLDDDGDLDVVVSDLWNSATVLLNRSANQNRWFRVRLIGKDCNRDAVGAVATIETDSGDILRFVKGGGSYLSQHDLRLHWGVPEGVEIRALNILWPNGNNEKILNPRSQTELVVIQHSE